MEKEKSAGAVVFIAEKDGIKYLLLHYEAGHWDFPKGHVEKNETAEEAAKREVKEETGIEKIEILPKFKEKIHYFYKLEGALKSKEVVFFLAKTGQKEVNISFEHIGFAWLTYDEALERLTYKTAKDILKKANGFLGKNKGLNEFC
ncbi:NUDIX domain-containing protein [Candidatus Woesearchaeota archaeon]|nr:NUDIX domain-containing protein [Candidatus Woesearchaeota archaeon]